MTTAATPIPFTSSIRVRERNVRRVWRQVVRLDGAIVAVVECSHEALKVAIDLAHRFRASHVTCGRERMDVATAQAWAAERAETLKGAP